MSSGRLASHRPRPRPGCHAARCATSIVSSRGLNAVLALVVALGIQIGHELRQRLRRWRAGHRRGAGRPGATGGGGAGHGAAGQVGGTWSPSGWPALAGLGSGGDGQLVAHPARVWCAGSRAGPTRGARVPTATSGSASCSCSSSSASWRRWARPMCSTPRSRSFGGHLFGLLRWAFALWAGVPVGLLAAALLEANNMRDIETDTEAGKKTLAVRLGRRRAGLFYVAHAGRAGALVGDPGRLPAVGARRPGRVPLAIGPVAAGARVTEGQGASCPCWVRRPVSSRCRRCSSRSGLLL